MRAPLGQALRLAQVRAKDLAVMFDLARLLQLRVERLLAVLAVVVTMIVGVVAAMQFEHAAALLGEHHGDIPMTVHALGSEESFLAEMSQIA
jgi:hypothetical protein